MSMIGKTDALHDQQNCGGIHSDETRDSGVGTAHSSLPLDITAVTISDGPENASCGSDIKAAVTVSDAIPCRLHLIEDAPSTTRDALQSSVITNRPREPLPPSLSTEVPTVSPLPRRKPVEQAEFCTQETVGGADLSQMESVNIQRRPERAKEEPEFFDVAMIYCQEDEELAKKFGDILQKFILIDGQHQPRIYMDYLDLRGSLSGHETEHFNYVLSCSSYAFVFFSPKSVNSVDLKGRWDRTIALHGSITDKNCAKVVPIVTVPNLQLPYSFGSYTKIILRSLLRDGRILDLVAVDDLKLEHIDKRLLDRISRALNEARAKRRCKVTKCELSNFEQTAELKQSTTETVCHMERIQAAYDVLVDSMDTEFGLLTYLFSKEVLSHREMESIAAENTRHGKNEKLLNLLYRKDANSFEKFVCGLSESNQDHLARRLREPKQK